MDSKDLYRRPPQLFEPNPNWKIFFACKRGKSHIATGKVCQDYCVAEKITEEIFIAAVADGHGGEDYVKSDVGSVEACNTVIALAKKYSGLDGLNFLAKWNSPEFREELFDTWQTAVLQDYRAENPEVKESDAEIIKKYGTTLLFAVVTKTHIIIGQVGDGAILFFNDQNQSQLFKRHNPKFDSKTSSLASGRGIYSLIIDSYKRFGFKFNKIILSTDGIYDKLDRDDNFAKYADALAAQIREKPLEEIQPFTINNIDVSEKSSDDCTIAAIISPPIGSKYESDGLQTLKDLKFERAYSRLEIYSANLDGAAIELHVSKYLYDENYSFDKLADKIKLIKPVPKTSRSNINLFKIPEELFRVQELIEHGEHLEKKYISDEPQRFSNEFWLNFYETIRELKKLFRVKKYFAEENFFKTMMISERGEIFLFADCLSKSVFKETSSRKLFETIESYFSFLGKIRCDDKILPIFKCPKYSAGQIISFDGRTFGRVLYNPKMNAYGLKNLSGKIWLAKDKQVQPNQNLVLMENYVIETDSKLYAIELFMTE
ncbi:MAG: protein phosphatase 2C domain-containing protein [Selenomonadaceae bacterium]|nr:protein phosphatase 2C domain-containing protein [Selenomonadaceae bacterium]